MTSIFSSEAEMQAWLKSKLEDGEALGDIIHNLDEINDAIPQDQNERTLLASYRRCIESLYINEIISADENISADKDDILRPDFVLYAPETESIVIVELKNISGPTREAGTELGAYTCEIRAYVPFIADGDIVNVIVSVEWPALLKHYVRQEIFWQRRNVICLRPSREQEEIRLEILPPRELVDTPNELKIPPQYMGGYQICLYDHQLYTPNRDRTRLDSYIEQFKTSLKAMASTGSRINSHGFAFLWRDLWEKSLAPYSITILNFAPFQTVERFLHIDDGAALPRMFNQFCRLVQEHSPKGHGKALSEVAHSADPFLKAVCSPRYEGFTDWQAHEKELTGSRSDLIAFVAWGRFEELFLDRLKKEYESGNLEVDSMDPLIGLEVVDSIVDDEYEFVDLAYLDLENEENSEIV